MRPIYLNFSTFYQSVVKTRTSYLQYDSVSILLYGKPRGDSISEISDRTASYYVTGVHNISRICQKNLLILSTEEIINRFMLLNFQDLDDAVEACKKLLSIVTELSINERNKLLAVFSNDEVAESANYNFLASVFLHAIRCRQVVKLNKEEQEYLSSFPMLNDQPTALKKESMQKPCNDPYESKNCGNDVLKSIYSFFSNDLSMQLRLFQFPEQLSMFTNFCEFLLDIQQNHCLSYVNEEDMQILYRKLRYHDYLYAAKLSGDLLSIEKQISLLNLGEIQNIIAFTIFNIDLLLEDWDEHIMPLWNTISNKASKNGTIVFGVKAVENIDHIECVLLWS